MLLELTVENYRSFKELSTLSLLAEPLKNDGIAIKTTTMGDSILPTVGIFGQNAGGKSNLYKALSVMANSIWNINPIVLPIGNQPFLQPFALSVESRTKPIHLEIVLWDAKTASQYRYGFEVGNGIVQAEWLEITDRPQKNRRSRLIFERDKAQFSFAKTVRNNLEHLKPHVLETALAVNVFGNLGDPQSRRMLELLSPQHIKFIDASDTANLVPYALDRYHGNEKLASEVVSFIRKADTGIASVSVDKFNISSPNWPIEFQEDLKSKISIRPAVGFGYIPKSSHVVYDQDGNKTEDRQDFDFVTQESLGTQKMFALAVVLLEALHNGEIVVLDELGSSLHPFITKKIVELFQDPLSNKSGAQLIFMSHDTLLLSKDSINSSLDLRRDQIWFVDKREDEVSILRRLSEYRAKKEYELSKRYLEGRFGAVPILDF